MTSRRSYGEHLSKRKASNARKSERYAKLGRELEVEVSRILETMVKAGHLSGYKYSKPNSFDDGDGKDFIVIKTEGYHREERCFGVTISMRRWNVSRAKHPNVTQFCFPIGTKPETIKKRVLELFK